MNATQPSCILRRPWLLKSTEFSLDEGQLISCNLSYRSPPSTISSAAAPLTIYYTYFPFSIGVMR